jgi:hypothetical protein
MSHKAIKSASLNVNDRVCRVFMIFCRDAPPGRLYPDQCWMFNPHYPALQHSEGQNSFAPASTPPCPFYVVAA